MANPEAATVSIRALVVDDQRTMRSIIRDLLNRVGIHDVVEAEDGEMALEILRNPMVEDPDVIICDIHMKNMDGTEFCNSVRRDDQLRDRAIPIIILTGDQNKLIHEVARQVGAATVLIKPIAASDLEREIEVAIGFTG